LAEELLARRLPIFFSCCMQALNWSESDHGLIELLWRSGLESVLVGIEAGCDEDLALWRKRSTVADNERVIALLRQHEVLVHFGFISIHPYSSFATVRQNHAFLIRSGVGYNLERFLSRLELYAGAEMAEVLRRDGLLLPSYDGRCDEYGYAYVDPRIERLSLRLNSLYGDYNAHYGVARGPWKFEAEDSAVHLLFSRLRRRHLTNPEAAAILDAHKAAADAVRAEMAEFNAGLVGRYVDAAEADALDDLDLVADSAALLANVERGAERLRRTQVGVSLALRRAGFAPDAGRDPAGGYRDASAPTAASR
jgi:hypothetical protein